MITIWPVGRNGDGDRELKIVACGGEALGGGELIAKSEPMCREQGTEEHDDKVHDQRSGDTDNGHDLMDNPRSLRSKEDQDGEEQANQGPRTRPLDEDIVVPLRPSDGAKSEAGDNGSAEWDAEEDSDALRDGRVRHVDVVLRVTNDSDEEYRERGEEDHLKQ